MFQMDAGSKEETQVETVKEEEEQVFRPEWLMAKFN